MNFLWQKFQMLKWIFSKFMENTPLHRGRNVVTAWFEKKHYDASWSDLLMSSSFAHVNVVPYTYKVSTSQFHTYFSFIASLCTVEIWYFMYLQHTPNATFTRGGHIQNRASRKFVLIKVSLGKDYFEALLLADIPKQRTRYLQIYRTFLENFSITLNLYRRK